MQSGLDVHNRADKNSQSLNLPLAIRKQNLITSAIAMLSDKEIKMMNREDLLNALRIARSQWPRSEERNIDNMDVTELRRVLAIAREHFRALMNQHLTRKNWSPEFN